MWLLRSSASDTRLQSIRASNPSCFVFTTTLTHRILHPKGSHVGFLQYLTGPLQLACPFGVPRPAVALLQGHFDEHAASLKYGNYQHKVRCDKATAGRRTPK